MEKQRRSFTTEYNREAAELVTQQGYTVIEASRSLGIGESLLRRWVKQLWHEEVGITPKARH